MNRGLYAAASAMLVQETNLDVITNNLANVSTAGFRRRISANADFSAMMDRVEKISGDGETKIMTVPPFTMNWKGQQVLGSMALASVYSQSFMDTRPGVVQVTEAPFDAVIDGPGFFSVMDGAGNTFYTRQGNFMVGPEGNLVTPDGMTLMSEGGPIPVGDATSALIMNDGRVIADGEAVGTISLFTFENPTFLRQVGGSMLTANADSGAPIAVEEVRLVTGALEFSNVSVVEEMVRMIEAQRAYEGASKALMAHDEATGRLIATFGRV